MVRSLQETLKTLRISDNTFENHAFGLSENLFGTGSPENP